MRQISLHLQFTSNTTALCSQEHKILVSIINLPCSRVLLDAWMGVLSDYQLSLKPEKFIRSANFSYQKIVKHLLEQLLKSYFKVQK